MSVLAFSPCSLQVFSFCNCVFRLLFTQILPHDTKRNYSSYLEKKASKSKNENQMGLPESLRGWGGGHVTWVRSVWGMLRAAGLHLGPRVDAAAARQQLVKVDCGSRISFSTGLFRSIHCTTSQTACGKNGSFAAHLKLNGGPLLTNRTPSSRYKILKRCTDHYLTTSLFKWIDFSR